MIVQSLKSRVLVLVLFIINTYTYAQVKSTPCNRKVELKSYEKDLIKEVCIPLGHTIYYIETKFNDIDINGDSLPDFIFDWKKDGAIEGDTLFTTAYMFQSDSTYKFLKTFKNIMPIKLDSYDKPSKNPFYAQLWSDCYRETYPLKYVDFNNGNIELSIVTEPHHGLEINYKYSKQKNNWILKSIKAYSDISGEGKIYIPHPMPETEETIDDFSYEKYLCPERLIKE